MSAKTPVIHVRDWDRSDEDCIYIGRAMPRQGLKASPWGNPYRIGRDCTREQAIERYRAYLQGRLYGDLSFTEEVADLSGRTLVCWCKPDACHGDVLAEYADALAQFRRQEADHWAEMADARSL